MKINVERAKNLQVVLYESVWNGNFEKLMALQKEFWKKQLKILQINIVRKNQKFS